MMDVIPALAGGGKTASVSAKADAPPSGSATATDSASPLEPATWQTPASSENADQQARDPATSAEQLKQAVESINSLLQNQRRALEFSLDEETGHVVITVMDIERNEVIRQIPSELALKLIARFREDGDMLGTGLSEKA